MTDSQQLLAQYRQNGSDAAFRELVTRYVDLVYSTALRLVEGDTHRAEDVAQTVFVDLARKARTFPHEVRLGGWLHRDACLVAGHTMRGERRRQSRERQAVEMNVLEDHSEADFSPVAPLLDDAIDELGEADRTAILLRFFEQQDFRAVGQALGSSEDAARMRVTRALDKLHTLLTHRGATLSAAALGTALATEAVTAAPAGLAATISSVAILAGTTITTTVTATKAITMTTLQKTIVGGLLAAALGTGIYEARQISLLHAQGLKLQQQNRSLTEQIQHLTQERDELVSKLAGMGADKEQQRRRKEHLELMSLRGRVTQLADQVRQLKAGGKEGEPTRSAVPEPKDADTILFSAFLTNRVGRGQTLVAGGWSMNGMRGYLLLTPAIQESAAVSDGQRFQIQSQVITAPEGFWSQIGWADAKSDARRSSVAGVLTPEQLDTLLAALKGTAGAELWDTSQANCGEGDHVGLAAAIKDERGVGQLMGIDCYPQVGADGQSVELEIRPSAVTTNTPIHSSLKPAGQPVVPSGP